MALERGLLVETEARASRERKLIGVTMISGSNICRCMLVEGLRFVRFGYSVDSSDAPPVVDRSQAD